MLQVRNEQLQGSCKILETDLQKQVEYQAKQTNLLEKLESIESLFHMKFDTLKKNLHTLEGKFEDQWRNLCSIVSATDKPDIGKFD